MRHVLNGVTQVCRIMYPIVTEFSTIYRKRVNTFNVQ
jgi:hypothetical protein